MDVTAEPGVADFEVVDDYKHLKCHGKWIIGQLGRIEAEIKTISKKGHHGLTIDMSEVKSFDSAGAVLIQKLIHIFKKKKKDVNIVGLSENFTKLLSIIAKEMDYDHTIPRQKYPGTFYMFGYWLYKKFEVLLSLFSFFGRVIFCFGHAIRHPRYFSVRAIASVFHTNCYMAMPIAGLLVFLVGVVLGYQMLQELAAYGMKLFIVNVSSLLVLREFGPLMTAIIAAGRTGTAFSAQIGTMIVNDEVDALKTMGIRPLELLVIPKIIGVVIALPLLTIWADIWGMFGSMLTAKVAANISFYTFITHFHQQVPLRYFLIGLLKAPVFAILITMVGCFQGFRAEKNANSVGMRTTQSAVQALFLIIIADALSSVLFSWDV
ncbi:MAG: ABC transporter permease [Coxiellaceae bacterium]|nr:ABC transporter permease [Coxiellaceae bacterium]